MAQPLGVSASFIRYFLEVFCGEQGVELETASTKDICNQVILPLTAEQQVPFVDIIPELQSSAGFENDAPWVAPATVFVSHAWAYLSSSVFGTMLEYAAQRPEAETYFWFDLFLNNQNGFEESHDFEWLCGRFKDSIRDIGTVMLVLTPWHDPVPLTRSWCLWELVSTIQMKDEVKFDVILPSSERSLFRQAILENSQVVYDSFVNVKAERAQAFKDSDRLMIARAIQETVGYSSVNAMVKDQLMDWVQQSCREILADFEAKGQLDTYDYGAACFQINSVMELTSGDRREMIQLLSSALRAFEGNPEETVHHRVICYQRIGNCHVQLDEHAAAKEMLDKAFDLYKQHPELPESIEYDIRVSMTYLYHQKGDYANVVDQQEKSIELLNRIYGPDHIVVADTKMNLAVALHEQGEFEKALELLLEVEKVQCREYGDQNPQTCYTQDNLGWCLFELGRYEEALAFADKGLQARRSTFGDQNSETAFSRITSAQILVAMGRPDEAISMLQAAKDECTTSFYLGYLYHVWGQALFVKSEFASSKENLNKAIAYRRDQGSKTDEAGRSLFWLAKAVDALGDHEQAIVIAQEAAELLTSGLGTQHQDSIKAATLVEHLLEQKNKQGKSQEPAPAEPEQQQEPEQAAKSITDEAPASLSKREDIPKPKSVQQAPDNTGTGCCCVA